MKSNRPLQYLFITLFSLLGTSFYYSVVFVNITFYITSLAGIILFICTDKAERKNIVSEIFSSLLFKIVLLWFIILYGSILYASSENNILLYVQKYKKFALLFFIIYVIIYFTKRKIQLSQYFLKGLIWGGVLLFLLGIAVKIIGFKGNHFPHGYWVPSGAFITSLLFSIVAVAGILFLHKKQWLIGLSLLFIGLFEVFYVLHQRTGYIGLLVAIVWLIAILPIAKYRYKLGGLLLTIVLVVALISTNNPVSKRMNLVFSEIGECYTTAMNDQDNANDIVKKCNTSSGVRLFFYIQSIKQIEKSWLYGYGLGGLDIVAPIKDDSGKLQRASNPHNEYLLQGIQLGIIGIILLLSIFILALRESLSIQVAYRRYLLSSIVLIYAISCLFNSFLLDTMEGILFIMVLSIIMSEWLKGKHQNETHHS